MNHNHSDYSLHSQIESDTLLAYIYGDLPEELNRALTAEIAQNIGLRMMVNGMIQVKETKGFISQEEHRQWLEKRSAAVDAVLFHHQRTLRNQRLRMVLAFASVILLIVYLLNLPLFSSPKLYKKYQAKPEITLAKAETWPLQNPALFTSYYTDNQYLRVLEECNRMLSVDSTLLDLRLYTGFCYLELNDPQKAMEEFSRIMVAASDDDLCTEATWQYGLAYIKARDFEHAIQIFDTLKGSGRMDKKVKNIRWRARIRNFVLQNIVHRNRA
ncbi:MAG: hypothetical protein R3C61_25925 [Bacteroidia bacterium]